MGRQGGDVVAPTLGSRRELLMGYNILNEPSLVCRLRHEQLEGQL